MTIIIKSKLKEFLTNELETEFVGIRMGSKALKYFQEVSERFVILLLQEAWQITKLQGRNRIRPQDIACIKSTAH